MLHIGNKKVSYYLLFFLQQTGKYYTIVFYCNNTLFQRMRLITRYHKQFHKTLRVVAAPDLHL